MLFVFALAFYRGQIQTINKGSTIIIFKSFLAVYCATAFEGSVLYLAWYFLPRIQACSFSCKNLIFLISIPSSNLSQSPVLLLSSVALRMLPSLVPSAVFINLPLATSPRTLKRLFSNGSSKADPEISLNNEILSPAQFNSNSCC